MKKRDQPSLADLGLDEPAQVQPKVHPPRIPEPDLENLDSKAVPKRTGPPPTNNQADAAPPSRINPMYGLLLLGWLLTSLGIGILIAFGSMDTTVVERGAYGVAAGRIHNIGLQQQQILGFMSGLTASLGGILTLALRSATTALMAARR